MLHKTLNVVKTSDGWIQASTGSVDRDSDRVMPLGGNLESFKRNPILFFGHEYSQASSIVGTAERIVQDANGLRILPKLRKPVNESDPQNIVLSLWNEGILKAASIGFIPVKWTDNEFGGKDFHEWELLEVSLVGLPSQREALRLAAKALAAGEKLTLADEQRLTAAMKRFVDAVGESAPPVLDVQRVRELLRGIERDSYEWTRPADNSQAIGQTPLVVREAVARGISDFCQAMRETLHV